MRQWRRISVLVFVLGLILGGVPAGAHPEEEDHPGWYIPSPESQSSNVKLLASSERTRPDSTYRNSDLAFWGDLAYAGHYDGFRILDISEPGEPTVLSDFNCPGSQHDVSVWKNLMFLSIDRPRTAPECDSVPTPVVGGATTPGFEGIRIFDVEDPTNPSYLGAVATDCGSHTHTLVPDQPNDRVLLYVSSYPASAFGPSPYGNDCKRLNEDGSQGHSKIAIVEVPLSSPQDASVIEEPRFELNDLRGILGYRGCHDITVFQKFGVAAASCMSEGQIWDISNIENPTTVARIHNPSFDFWHNAAFTWDGEMVAFGDEAGGGTGPRCRQQDPSTLGAVWFYDVSELDNMTANEVEAPLGHFKTSRIQGDLANCTTHNFNFIPTDKGYTLVSAYYAAGTSVISATDPSAPKEIAHFDPHGANTWSSYWYNNFIYTNDSGRGSDVLLLSDKARAGAKKMPYMNPQTQ